MSLILSSPIKTLLIFYCVILHNFAYAMYILNKIWNTALTNVVLAGGSSCKAKGHQFDSWSGHMSGFQFCPCSGHM